MAKFFFRHTSLFFREFPVLCEMIAQVSSWHKINNQIKVLSVLECIMHIYKESKNKGLHSQNDNNLNVFCLIEMLFLTFLEKPDQYQLTYGWRNYERNFFSFMTELTLLFEITLPLCISFIANNFFSFFFSTFQTFPNPPRPIT